jgi:hypothetical protein
MLHIRGAERAAPAGVCSVRVNERDTLVVICVATPERTPFR